MSIGNLSIYYEIVSRQIMFYLSNPFFFVTMFRRTKKNYFTSLFTTYKIVLEEILDRKAQLLRREIKLN